jgi:putative hydrolase of the HAD superfamily
MIDMKNIKAIIFDSGRVLNYPRTGHWFMPPNFFKYVDKNKFAALDMKLVEMAFHKAMNYLEGYPLILNEEEEFERFVEFYYILADELKDLGLSKEQVIEIAKDTVFNDEKFVFYEDVFEYIPRLAKHYKLGVISDTWPSLDRVFKNAGIRQYFSTFVMSSVLGVLKPHELMYITALKELGVKPEEALFIDDNLVNVEGAKKLGMQGLVILRDNQVDGTEKHGGDTIRDIKEFMELLHSEQAKR